MFIIFHKKGFKNFIKFRLHENWICHPKVQKVIECLEVGDTRNIKIGFQQMVWYVMGWAEDRDRVQCMPVRMAMELHIL
jgi:hypothetical protein